IINFLILVLLLKRYLYGRIIRAMDERRDRLNAQLNEAVRKREDAEREAEAYRRKQQELEEQRASLVAQARQEAKTQRRELLNAARREVDEEKSRWMDTLHEQEEAFYRSLRESIGKQVFETTRIVLEDLADDDLDRRIIETFIARVRDMDESGMRELKEKARSSGEVPVVSSAGGIPPDLRGKITALIREVFQTGAEIRF
ncbi:MAG: F0F1 ATP synthase subunit B family protein, partial [Candidatus Latescibacterota bacterium]